MTTNDLIREAAVYLLGGLAMIGAYAVGTVAVASVLERIRRRRGASS